MNAGELSSFLIVCGWTVTLVDNTRSAVSDAALLNGFFCKFKTRNLLWVRFSVFGRFGRPLRRPFPSDFVAKKHLITYCTVENVKPIFSLFYVDFPFFVQGHHAWTNWLRYFRSFWWYYSVVCTFSKSYDTRLVTALVCTVHMYHMLCTPGLSQFILACIS